MQPFRHVIPAQRLFVGSDSLAMLAGELDRLGSRRALIVCAGSLARAGAPLAQVCSAVDGRLAGIFSAVQAASPLPAVEEAAQQMRELQADAVIAVGGGSAMVTARAATILLAEGKDARQLCTRREAGGRLVSPRLLAPKLPQLVVPTTPTTASVRAGGAVLDPGTRQRLALYDPKVRPQAVFVSPDLLATAPAGLFADAAVNAMALAIEGLLSRVADPVSDALLMHSVRLFAQYIPWFAQDPSASREAIAVAAALCGQGSAYTGAGAAISLGHAIGSVCDASHGTLNAILLPHALRYNAGVADEALGRVLDALGGSAATANSRVESVNDRLDALFAGLCLPRRLRDVGVAPAQFPGIAAECLDDWYLAHNPRTIGGAGELVQLLSQAW